MPDETSVRGRARICCCVLMNHPFPANLPLLRRLYAERFTHLRFLVPFERLQDEDVITVYRGSYLHAAYLTDAWHELRHLECDYFLVVHDDVLLNPQLDENTFQSLFGLGLNDAFIPRLQTMPPELGRWIWYLSFVPKLLYPKSLLFGSGVERANLSKYLPPAQLLAERMAAGGLTPTEEVKLHSGKMEDVARHPSRVLLHGLAEPIHPGDEQDRLEADSFALEQQFVDILRSAQQLAPMLAGAAPAGETGEGTVKLPIPIVHAGYCTDFYILPRNGAADFCHYMGVAAAAGLFVEIIAPTLLYAVSERVVTGAERGLDFSGFDRSRGLDCFADPRVIALHPFKLSAFRDPARAEALLALLATIATGKSAAADLWTAAGLMPQVKYRMDSGWHPPESWGSWSNSLRATLHAALGAATAIRLNLRAPTHPAAPTFAGQVSVDGQHPVGVEVTWPETGITMILPRSDRRGGETEFTLVADRLVRPKELDEQSDDDRALGFGIVAVEAIGAINIGR